MNNGILAILERDSKILLLKRSAAVTGYSGWWYGVGGRIEHGESPLEAALREIKEEIGLGTEQLQLIKAGRPISGEASRIYPFLFHTSVDCINLDWEHDDCAWVAPAQITNYKCVPVFLDVLRIFRIIGPVV